MAVIWAQESLNWASVVAYLAIPVAFVVGARFERTPRLRWGPILLTMTVLLVGVLAVGTAGGFAPRGGPSGGYSWTNETHGYSMIAPWWAEPGSPESNIVDSEMGWGTLGIDSVSIEASSAAAIARFSDWRLEAWRAEAPQDGWALAAGQTKPFASFPAVADGTTISGMIAFDQEPDVEWAQIVLTATGPDGRRYLIWASGPEQSEFFGSVWSWFQALAR